MIVPAAHSWASGRTDLQVNSVMSMRDTVTQQNTNSSDDLAKMAEDLATQAVDLKDTLRASATCHGR